MDGLLLVRIPTHIRVPRPANFGFRIYFVNPNFKVTLIKKFLFITSKKEKSKSLTLTECPP